MSKDFSIKLNGREYNQNNIPDEIQLKGKTENEDVLSVFDSNKDGKLSKSEIKSAIFALVDEETRVSGSMSDSNISDQEAENIAKHFMNGKFKIGENIQNLVKELQNRIKKQVENNELKAKNEKLIKVGVNPNQVPITTKPNSGNSDLRVVMYDKNGNIIPEGEYYGRKDGTVVDKEGNLVPDMQCKLTKELEGNNGEKYEVYDFSSIDVSGKRKTITSEDGSISFQALDDNGEPIKDADKAAVILDLKKEKAEGLVRSLVNKLSGKENHYVYTKDESSEVYPSKYFYKYSKSYYKWTGEGFELIKKEAHN